MKGPYPNKRKSPFGSRNQDEKEGNKINPTQPTLDTSADSLFLVISWLFL